MTYSHDRGATSHPFSVKALRNFCADELIRTQGAIPGMLYSPFEDGQCKETLQRDGSYKQMNLAEYADGLRSNLYGGDLEICIFVWLFKLKVFVFNSHQWNGEGDKLAPAVHEFFSTPELSSNPNQEHADLLEICLLWEQGETGGQDHYSLIIPTRKSTDAFRLSSDSDDDQPPKASVLYVAVAVAVADLLPPPPPSPPPVATGSAPSEEDMLTPTPPHPAVKKPARSPKTPASPVAKKQARLQLFRDEHDEPYAPAPPSPTAEPPKHQRVYRHWHAVRSHSLLACVRARACVF